MSVELRAALSLAQRRLFTPRAVAGFRAGPLVQQRTRDGREEKQRKEAHPFPSRDDTTPASAVNKKFIIYEHI
jgi:hypothetical protein